MVSSKVPEVAKQILPRTASVLLPRFQEVAKKWEVEKDRQSVAPGSPDIGIYLQQYVEKSVETDAVSYEAARAELKAAERLCSPDFFEKYPNVDGRGLTNAAYQDLKLVNMDPSTPDAKKILRRMMYEDVWEARKGHLKNGALILSILFALMGFASAWNSIIRHRAITS